MVFLHGALTLLLLAIGLLAPGWLLGRVCRTPAGPVGAFLGSAAILLNLVLLLDACGVSLTALHLRTGFAARCAPLALVAARAPAAQTPVAPTTSPRKIFCLTPGPTASRRSSRLAPCGPT
jgi:hypothetical protein